MNLSGKKRSEAEGESLCSLKYSAATVPILMRDYTHRKTNSNVNNFVLGTRKQRTRHTHIPPTPIEQQAGRHVWGAHYVLSWVTTYTLASREVASGVTGQLRSGPRA